MGTVNALETSRYFHHEASSTCSKTTGGDIIGFGLGRGVVMDGEQLLLGSLNLWSSSR